jgi:hypothetical protein
MHNDNATLTSTLNVISRCSFPFVSFRFSIDTPRLTQYLIPEEVGIEYSCGKLNVYSHGSPVAIQPPAHWNVIDGRMAVPIACVIAQ